MRLPIILSVILALNTVPAWALGKRDIREIQNILESPSNALVETHTDPFEEEAARLYDSNPEAWGGTVTMEMARFYRNEALQKNLEQMQSAIQQIQQIQHEIGVIEENTRGRLKAIGSYEEMATGLVEIAKTLPNTSSGYATSEKIKKLVQKLAAQSLRIKNL